MYVPSAFSVAGRRFALDLIARHPFGLLVTSEGSYPHVTHLPMLGQERDGELWIVGHVARANAHAQSIVSRQPACVVFEGPHAYVSASWYEKPSTNVPTWNYTAVHALGRLAECDAESLLIDLTAAFEGGRSNPWRLGEIDAEYYEEQLRGIVAFEMRVECLRAAAKLSQNRSVADRARVEAELSGSERSLDRECAQAMRAVQESPEETPKRDRQG
jgi:transcriptional regulator